LFTVIVRAAVRELAQGTPQICTYLPDSFNGYRETKIYLGSTL
jgi:hypothetical protein